MTESKSIDVQIERINHLLRSNLENKKKKHPNLNNYFPTLPFVDLKEWRMLGDSLTEGHLVDWPSNL